MEMIRIKKSLSSALCIVLITATALFTFGCNDNKTQSSQEQTTVAETTLQADSSSQTDSNVLGEGETQFDFTVTEADGNETAFEIHTDKTTVGDALLELDLIDGDQGDYGLYVTSVNGITADWAIENAYWAFYINGEYAMTGVDSTEITDGATYSFVKTVSYTELGEGATDFYLTVQDVDGTVTKFLIHTDAITVGEALLALELIAGDESDYGLYVTSVNGITADWDSEKSYWAFYIDGEYAQTGVDSTEIVVGTSYELVKTVSEE